MATLSMAPQQYHLTLPELTELADLSHLLVLARQAAWAHQPVQVDCSAVEFLSTGVLQILIGLQRTMMSQGYQLVLHGVSQSVEKYLRISGLDRVLSSSLSKSETP